MKMKRFVAVMFILGCFNQLLSQRMAETAVAVKRYQQAQVVDSSGSISVYNALMICNGGDSTNRNAGGFNLQGWNEEFYESGKILHRGYYVDGKLITFKNFFESGQCERSVDQPDPLHCLLEIFFESGSMRRQVIYYNGLPQKQYEYYENGQPKYAEENEKEMKYLTLKKAWYDNGYLKSDLELLDRKNKKYRLKNYYNNGQVSEEGLFVLSSRSEYLKEGLWTSYDRDGKNKRTEKHELKLRANSR